VPGGGIMGVYSRSNDKPIKMAGFAEEDRSFESALHYSQWRFIYQPVLSPVLQTPVPPKRGHPARSEGGHLTIRSVV
jgi:hypothetical protein